ncbi:DUF3168 domain-containing protein [Tropicimonas sp. IMCC34011]|uniref:DUF3168 domain-containing protein n=1 Tax=Tropicimonas sp. IMCC34011 TaxID=2248759 RepID=UPI000E21E8C3|nr:DUF3168 domain-containing protein [Tropicimonas sp. IMCC34011]
MSYALGLEVQSAIFGLLTADATLTALVGGDIFDAAPPGAVPPLYVTLGEESVRAAGDSGGAGAWHRVSLRVVSVTAGFAAAKEAAAAISIALDGARPALAGGRVVSLRFARAIAKRQRGGEGRTIDLRFDIRVDASA